MSRQQHWKERFDPDTDFVFLKSMTLFSGKVSYGDPVPKGILSKHRLRLWFEAGYIGRADFHTHVKVVSVQRKGPWFCLTFEDGTKKNVRKNQLKEYDLDGTPE